MPKEKPQILLAEDDINLGNLLVDHLESEGFEVSLCKNGEQALKIFAEKRFDVCLLDVMMPVMDGFSLAEEIRKKDKRISLIFITAKSLKEDKLAGYELGADDYITKPFDEEELIWKIKALLRRSNESSASNPTEPIQIGRYSFDYNNLLLSTKENSKRITEKEADILLYLCKNRNKIIKREEMLKELWGQNDYFLGRSLDVFITKIRKYLKEDPNLKIENVFGVGFILKVPENETQKI